MKALTVQQPWAGLIVLGIKTCETRSWNTKHRGQLAIHSSAKMTKEGEKLLKELMKEAPEQFFKDSEAYKTCTELGAILGTVSIRETYSTNDSTPTTGTEKRLGDYSPNRYFWHCVNPAKFASPIHAKGALSLWEFHHPFSG